MCYVHHTTSIYRVPLSLLLPFLSSGSNNSIFHNHCLFNMNCQYKKYYNHTHTLKKLAKKDIEIQPGFELGLLNAGQMLLPTEPLELWHWSRGWMVYIHRHSSILRLDLIGVGFALHDECWSNSPYSSTEELFAATLVNWVSGATVHVLSEPLQGLTGNISPGEKQKSHTKCFACLRSKQL